MLARIFFLMLGFFLGVWLVGLVGGELSDVMDYTLGAIALAITLELQPAE